MKALKMHVSKYAIVFIAFILVCSNTDFMIVHAANQSTHTSNSISKQQTEEESKNRYKPTDEVNVVIELAEKSGVMVAQESNQSFSELSKDIRETLHNRSLNEQEEVKHAIDEKGISIEYLDSFTAIFNGFSANVLYEDIEAIEQLDHVKKVYISEEYEQPVEPIKKISLSEHDQTESTSANEMVNATKVWEDIGYQGEGKIVAVIDRGIDVEHKDMILSEDTTPGLEEDDVNRIVDEQGLSGRYFTEKVPYGYNYADNNDTIKNVGDGANGHGIHVSGIVGANGDVNNGGIKGVAPEVQILGMKVYSNDQTSSTNSSIYVKAIDDAIKLDVDAINMSFGSAGRIPNPEDPAQIAAQRATENGTFVAKSAGNGYYFGEGHDELPYTANPDIGAISNSQIAEAAVQVANFENTHLDYAGLVYATEGVEDEIVPYNPAGKAPSPDDAIDENMREVVYVGYGRLPGDSTDDPDANDFEGIDVEGKIALIKRGGGVGFIAKTLNAQAHGASAVVVFNNDDSGYSSMSSNSDVKIPQVFILREPGEDMVKQLEDGKEVTIAFRDDRVKTQNPNSGQMYKSSSWGPMGALDFKPTLTAPGSHILSTLNDDSYGVKSGTSMSTPQVAGGATLVMEHIENEFDVSGLELTTLVKNMLMNTSKPIENISDTNVEFGIEGVPYSPRRQGAGLMDLYAAVTTPVVITETDSGQGGVALKEVGDTFTFSLEAQNYSDKDITYSVEGNIQTDLTEGKNNLLESVGVITKEGDIPISYQSNHGQQNGGSYELNIPANETVQIDVSVDLTNTVDEYLMESIKEHFINGRFIEGFIEFHDVEDIHPELSVPYVGFYGDWNTPPILDAFIHNMDESFYGKAGMVFNDDDEEYTYLGVNPITEEPTDHYAISPNNEKGPSHVIPALTFLRNAQEVKFSIEDEDGAELTTLQSLIRVRKHLDPSSPYTIFDEAVWDGKIEEEIVEDGLYYYVIKTKLSYENAEWQINRIPVYIDTEKPHVEVSLDKDTKVVEWNAEDDGSGVAFIEVFVNGELVSGRLAPEETSFTIEGEIDVVEVAVTDWANNTETVQVEKPTDPVIPTAAEIIELIDELKAEGEINHTIYQPLIAKLESVAHFENMNKGKNVIKHTKNFQSFLTKRYEKGQATDAAYETLIEQTDFLIEHWENK